MHYQRWQKHGDPTISKNPVGLTTEERFMLKVEKSDGCWLWTAHLNDKGYGQFQLALGKCISAHRWAYLHFVGPVPAGKELHHVCQTPRCVNPEHLTPLTKKEHGRFHPMATKAFCKNGHPFDAANTQYYKGTFRRCVACAHKRSREHYLKKKAEGLA